MRYVRYVGYGVLALFAFLFLHSWGAYNTLVTRDEGVKAAWSEVQSQYKRRLDLIPNLVRTVEEYATHEKGVFVQVTEARAKMAKAVNTDVSALASNPALQQQLLESQAALANSLQRLLAVAEGYPNLKASENFIRLQDELAGTENRVAVARGRAIKASQDYNAFRCRALTSLYNNLWHFPVREYYQAPENAEQPVQVTFGKG